VPEGAGGCEGGRRRSKVCAERDANGSVKAGRRGRTSQEPRGGKGVRTNARGCTWTVKAWGGGGGFLAWGGGWRW